MERLSLEQIEKAIQQPIAITIPNASVGPDPRDEYRQSRAARTQIRIHDPDEEVGGFAGSGRRARDTGA